MALGVDAGGPIRVHDENGMCNTVGVGLPSEMTHRFITQARPMLNALHSITFPPFPPCPGASRLGVDAVFGKAKDAPVPSLRLNVVPRVAMTIAKSTAKSL